MKFEEAIAMQIIERYNLSHITFRVWRTRGNIPKKYLIPGFKKRTPLVKIDMVVQERIINVLSNNKVNAKKIAEITGIPYQTVIDAILRRQNFSKEQLVLLRSEIQKARIKIKKTVEAIENKKVFSDSDKLKIKDITCMPQIILQPLLDFDRTEGGMIADWRRNRNNSPNSNDELLRKVVDRFVVFLIETTM